MVLPRSLSRRKVNREAAKEEVPVEAPRHFSLFVLTRSAGGGASFQLDSFQEAVSASDFIESWLRVHPGIGPVIGFWALTRQPLLGDDTDAQTEVAVLIRDASRPSLVHAFSFSEMLAAQSFARREVECGVDPGCLLIYWAAVVKVEANDAGRVELMPSTAPVLPVRPAPGENIEAAHGRIVPEVLSGESARADTTGESTDALQPALPGPEKESSASACDGQGRHFFQWESQPGVAMPKADLPNNTVPADIDVQQAAQRGGRTSAPSAAVAALQVANSEEQARPERSIAQQSAHPDFGEEVSRVLRVKRWDARVGPFHGFDSPPGRF